MPLVFRRILFVCFVLLFIVSAVVLLFYASGYRYHAGKRIIEKTGKLIVETEPRGARILLNGRAEPSSLTPFTRSYILSGEYELTVEKEGFFTVTRRITIAPGRSAVESGIVLIRKAAPTRILPLDALGATEMRGDTLFVHDTHTVYAIDLRFERARSVATSSEPIASIVVSESGSLFVVQTHSGWTIRDSSSALLRSDQIDYEVSQFRFAYESDDLYAQSADGIVRFDKEHKSFVPVLALPHTRSFFIVENELYLVNGDRTVDEYGLGDGKKMRAIADQPLFDVIVGSSNGAMVLADHRAQGIYLFDRHAKTPTFQHVSDADAIRFVGKERFFSHNDFELWEHIFGPDRYTRTLITRQSTPLTRVVPFMTHPFVLIVSENREVRLRFLAWRDHQELLLGRFDSLSDVVLNQKETTAYVVGSLNNEQGVYALPLIEEEALFPLVK